MATKKNSATGGEFFSPMAVSVNEAAKIVGTSRTALYEALQRKELSAKKNGRRTVILREELKRYLENLPEYGLSPTAD
ncbi:MAG: helix-turn-helix domain-containing protein [Allosphingosinicella sp.]|uniref:helix-turn-helix domain-containing protein n=1 Tax=Allosphingosinicella sp. TaxID=2823234 RepID=UPI003933386A